MIIIVLVTFCVLPLQFGNESLSLKLEEQISENEDLRNKYGICLFKVLRVTLHVLCNSQMNVYFLTIDVLSTLNILFPNFKYRNNATRNLCNILKDTLERSSKKMHLCK